MALNILLHRNTGETPTLTKDEMILIVNHTINIVKAECLLLLVLAEIILLS